METSSEDLEIEISKEIFPTTAIRNSKEDEDVLLSPDHWTNMWKSWMEWSPTMLDEPHW